MAGESPLATLGVELKGWKLCSPAPANVCIDVIKIKDAEQEENFESCADSVEGEDVESAEVGSSGGKSESQKCKTKSSDGGAEFLFHILDERTEEQRAYKAFLMNTIWGTSIFKCLFHYFIYTLMIIPIPHLCTALHFTSLHHNARPTDLGHCRFDDRGCSDRITFVYHMGGTR